MQDGKFERCFKSNGSEGVIMRRYLSEETREKLSNAGVVAGRFFSHFVPGYSSIRYKRLIDELVPNKKEGRLPKALMVGYDVGSTALGVFKLVHGYAPVLLLFIGTRASGGYGEVLIRYLMERGDRERGD